MKLKGEVMWMLKVKVEMIDDVRIDEEMERLKELGFEKVCSDEKEMYSILKKKRVIVIVVWLGMEWMFVKVKV